MLARTVEGAYGIFFGDVVSQAVVEFITEGPVELSVAACTATAIYLIYRSDKGEVASLRHLAVTDA